MKSKIKILLLEHNDEDAELIHRLLIKEFPHLQYKLVMNREDYLQQLSEFEPDVILSDNSIPQFNASEALELLRSCSPVSIPFILVTGAVSEEFATNIMKSGADDYILKDRMVRLPAAIKTAVKAKRSETERKEARRHLAESEEKYRTLYERNYTGVYQTNIKGDILSCNNAFATMFGYNSPEELQKKNASELYFSDGDRAKFINDLYQNKQITNLESLLKHKDGHVIHVLENLSLLNGAVKGEEIIEGIILDVTRQKKADEEREAERKNAEEILQKLLLEKKALAERMYTILNTLPATIALLDERGTIIDVNDEWRNFVNNHGYKGANYGIGNNYIDISSVVSGAKEENEKVISIGINAILNKLTNNFEYEYPCYSSDGEKWFRMIVTPLHEKEKGGVVVMHLNITEQKKNAAALEATLKELSDYKIALDESSIVSITDPEGVLTYVNTNFCTISQYKRDELLGKDHSIVNASFHDAPFIKELWSTISKGKIWRNKMKNKAKDGTYYWVDTTIVPFLDIAGKPLQYVAINKDITEQKLIEEELLNQKVQEQKKITRAIMTAQEKERNHLGEELHDNINQILAGARLYLSTSGSKNTDVEKVIKYPIELIDASIEEIRLLCRNLVTPVNNMDLDEMVKKLIYGYNTTTSIKTNFNYDVSPGIIKDDLKLNIYRIIQEQMNNIMKHAKAENVYIDIKEHYQAVNISLKDDGAGFNVKASRKGVGITNMINRIESYNGKVEIISSLGKGTTINIELPYQESGG